jgi:phosphotransferase system HPr (HPr) family protein
MSEIKLVIRNKVGLHARPLALFNDIVKRFQSDVRISKGGKEVNAKSPFKVLALAVNQNDEVVLRAEGPDADAALAAIAQLVADNFGER